MRFSLLQWLWAKLRGRAYLWRPQHLTVFALENFDRMQPHDWRRFESMAGGTGQDYLLYALRVASAIPKVKTLETLGSRWSTANCGAGDAGLELAQHVVNHREVRAFIAGLCLRQAQEILAARKSKKPINIHDVVAHFTPPLPGLRELLEPYCQ